MLIEEVLEAEALAKWNLYQSLAHEPRPSIDHDRSLLFRLRNTTSAARIIRLLVMVEKMVHFLNILNVVKKFDLFNV
jgi:hypothetical protein